MPRQKSLFTVIRDLVQDEVRQAVGRIFGPLTAAQPGRKKRAAGTPAEMPTEMPTAAGAKPANGRRRRHKRRGPGRPPKAEAPAVSSSKAPAKPARRRRSSAAK